MVFSAGAGSVSGAFCAAIHGAAAGMTRFLRHTGAVTSFVNSPAGIAYGPTSLDCRYPLYRRAHRLVCLHGVAFATAATARRADADRGTKPHC